MTPARKLESGKVDRTHRRRGPRPALPALFQGSEVTCAQVTVRSIPLPITSARGRDPLETPAQATDLLRFSRLRVCEVPEIRRPQAVMLELVGFKASTEGRPAVMQPRGRSSSCILPTLDHQNQGTDATVTGRRRPVSAGLLLELPGVHCGIERIMRQAFVRRGVAPSQIDADEAAGYLLEAERSRGVMPGDGEILAIFRRTPIELVSRMHFDERSRMLAYTLIPIHGIGRSRVHDFAALRDRSTGRTHWIPHRTRFQTAVLG